MIIPSTASVIDMTADIEVTPIGPSQYDVRIVAGGKQTMHRVTVPDELLAALGVPTGSEDQVVRESFVFLLEREPPTSILREFRLDVISRYFPDYEDALRARLT